MIDACPVCGAPEPSVFADLERLPVHCNVLWPTRHEAVAAPRGDLRLALCGQCGMIWNAAFDPAAVGYEPAYENSLHFSAVFRDYARSLAGRLVERYGIRDADVAEIGSGKGEFLALLCELGESRGVGYDPAYDGEVDAEAGDRLTFVRELFSAETALGTPDLLLCRHVLEHVEEPLAFLRGVRDAIGEDARTVCYFELPSGEYMLEQVALWDVIYEHCSFFTEPALRRLFERAGFEVLASGRSFGDQYVWIEAVPGVPVETVPPGAAVARLAPLAETFGGAARARRARWERELPALLDRGPVALWGAGSKGVTFLNLVPASAGVAAVVDVNPRKHGRHVAGAGQRIVAPDEPAVREARTVLVMNPLYRAEIEWTLDQLGAPAEVIVV